ncbi:MAG: hypothetical protein ACRD3C_03800 [Vicinamibacterales bacterium]
MTRALQLVLIAALTLTVPLAAQEPPSRPTITEYAVEGRNPDGTAYTARAEMSERDGLVYLSFYSPDNQLAALAVGVRDGPTMATIFQAGPNSVGLALYRAEGDQWLAQWFVIGEPGTGVETLSPFDPKLHGAELGPKTPI